MKRMWPDEFNAVLDNAQEVVLEAAPEDDGSDRPLHRNALKARIPMEDYERIWPLAEMRFRVGDGRFSGKAVTLITTNPHYHHWHPADGGSVEGVSDSGRHFSTRYVDIYFLLDDVRQSVAAE